MRMLTQGTVQTWWRGSSFWTRGRWTEKLGRRQPTTVLRRTTKRLEVRGPGEVRRCCPVRANIWTQPAA